MSKRFTVQEDANTKHILLLIDHHDKVMWSFMATHKEAVEGVLKRLNEQDERIQELTNKMNYQAFELYKYSVVSIGKAVELSNMSYHDFIEYCAENGHPVELRL